MYMLKIIRRESKHLKLWKDVWLEDGNDIIVNVILKVTDNAQKIFNICDTLKLSNQRFLKEIR